jgi:hypothetical protein
MPTPVASQLFYVFTVDIFIILAAFNDKFTFRALMVVTNKGTGMGRLHDLLFLNRAVNRVSNIPGFFLRGR